MEQVNPEELQQAKQTATNDFLEHNLMTHIDMEM